MRVKIFLDVSTLFNSLDIDSEEGKVSYYYVNQADSEKRANIEFALQRNSLPEII